MPDLFQTIQQTVSAREAAEHYGIRVSPKGWARCPFHTDKHPSMSFKGARWRCWVCNMSGDATDLVRELFGMTYVEAARRISDDFNLGLDFGEPTTPEQRKKAKQAAAKRERQKALQRQFETWRTKTLDDLTTLIRTANRADYNNLSGQEAAAIREKVRMEHLCDVLLHGSSEEQQKLFKDREDVKTLIDRILHPRP